MVVPAAAAPTARRRSISLGKPPEVGESLTQAAVREVAEEAGIRLHEHDLVPLVDVVTAAHGRPGTDVRLVCFNSPSDQEPRAAAEIVEVA